MLRRAVTEPIRLVEGALPLPSLLADQMPAEGVPHRVVVPGGQEFADTSSWPDDLTLDGGTATFVATTGTSFSLTVEGTPVTAWIVIGAIAVVVLVGALLLLVFRRRIGAAYRRFAARRAEQRAARPTVSAQGLIPPSAPVPGPPASAGPPHQGPPHQGPPAQSALPAPGAPTGFVANPAPSPPSDAGSREGGGHQV